jgi:hypothetical protein
MRNVLAAMLSFVIGAIVGAAIQRWGDWERSTEHHTLPNPRDEVFAWGTVEYSPHRMRNLQ